MAPQRPKRLPTDFFDRLLSNQTDDQINELLNSLVDEQILPTSEPGEEFASRTSDAEMQTPAVKRYGMPRDKIEDTIITQDEELEEEPLDESADVHGDDLIPRTTRMQSLPNLSQELSRSDTLVKEPPSPPGARERTPTVIPPEPVVFPPERVKAFGQPETEVEIPEVPEPPEWPSAREDVSQVISYPPPGVHGAPELAPPDVPEPPEELLAPPETRKPSKKISPKEAEALFQVDKLVTPEISAPPEESPDRKFVSPPPGARRPKTSPAKPAFKSMLEPLPSHEELRGARRRARWQRPKRKPKMPKMAKFTPAITVAPSRLAYLEEFLMPQTKEAISLRLTKLNRAALSFLLPAFIAFSLFSWYPMLKGLLISFFNYDPGGAGAFVGMQNYIRAFQDEMFWRTLWHAGGFCLMVLVLGFWLPIFISIFIHELPFGKRLFKFLFFLPFLMPTVPAAILWKWIMDQGFGLLNALLAKLPMIDPHIGWLTNPKLALLSIVFMYIWKNTGWAILIYSAVLGNIDETLYEEADTNGASIWAKVRHVTFPAMRGVIAVMLIITIINTLQLFTEVYIMTNGGPMNSTEVIATYIYKQAFFYMDLGYAAALSILLLVMLLFITSFRLRRLEAEGV